MESTESVQQNEEEETYGIKLDELGPIILNSDGTISRIKNWHELSDHERRTSLRRIAKRNQERKHQLEANPPVQQDEQDEVPQEQLLLSYDT
eukprot:gene36104-43780_t